MSASDSLPPTPFPPTASLSTADPSTAAYRLAPAEAALACGLLLTALALRLAGVWEYRFNSDEAQHAHVVWGWTRGLLQYRDFFDNHTPLFHMAWAPLLAAFGESVRTLFWLRLTMLPLYLGCLAITFAIGRRLLAIRSALWGTVLAALLPPFFLKTLEFRTDVPWTLLWLAAFQVLTGGPPGAARWLLAGLLVGTAAAVSLKSSLLLACLLGSALAAAAWRLDGQRGGWPGAKGRPGSRGWAGSPGWMGSPGRTDSPGWMGSPSWGSRAGWKGWVAAGSRVAAALAGMLAVPGAIALYFQRQGALDALLAGAVRHNLLVSQHGPAPLRRVLILAAGVPALVAAGRWAVRAGPPALARQRLLLLLTTGSYWIAMQVFWPLVTSQTYLPVEPLFCLFVAAAATGSGRAPAGPRQGVDGLGAGRVFLGVALAVELTIDLLHGPLRGDQTGPQTAIVAEALRLTRPDEAVFDDKGDLVFRRRAFYPVLEDITREAMARGRIADTIAESILASHACVATPESRRLPPRGRAFLAANFLPVGHLRVCGKWLPAGAEAAGGQGGAETAGGRYVAPPVHFAVAIPASYAIVGRDGLARGVLDGVELTAPRFLAAGSHTFRPHSPAPWALIWEPAAERGFSPFSAAALEQVRAQAAQH